MARPGYYGIFVWVPLEVHAYVQELAARHNTSAAEIGRIGLDIAIPLIASGKIKIGDQDHARDDDDDPND